MQAGSNRSRFLVALVALGLGSVVCGCGLFEDDFNSGSECTTWPFGGPLPRGSLSIVNGVRDRELISVRIEDAFSNGLRCGVSLDTGQAHVISMPPGAYYLRGVWTTVDDDDLEGESERHYFQVADGVITPVVVVYDPCDEFQSSCAPLRW